MSSIFFSFESANPDWVVNCRTRRCPSSACRHPLPVNNGEKGQAPALATPSPRFSRGEGKGEGQRKRPLTRPQSPSGSISLPVLWIWALYLMRRTVSRAEPSSL
ncbi:MAG: hypothetical protein EOS14_32195 [Mesorhizobium sp.]|nr:MAG: hypothetical protein EOS14_32195 [Mesorhizobium sp.]